jgi:murein DD-endopeptidase MepM/ murein hydrolase activator NlpD
MIARTSQLSGVGSTTPTTTATTKPVSNPVTTGGDNMRKPTQKEMDTGRVANYLNKYGVNNPAGKGISSLFGTPDSGGASHSAGFDSGTDSPGTIGDPVNGLVNGGKVLEMNYGSSGWGNNILVQLANGTAQRFSHLNDFNKDLKVGSTVDKSTVVGTLGNTGNTTGPHVDYEFTINGKTVKPEEGLAGYIFPKTWEGAEKGYQGSNAGTGTERGGRASRAGERTFSAPSFNDFVKGTSFANSVDVNKLLGDYAPITPVSEYTKKTETDRETNRGNRDKESTNLDALKSPVGAVENNTGVDLAEIGNTGRRRRTAKK